MSMFWVLVIMIVPFLAFLAVVVFTLEEEQKRHKEKNEDHK